MKRRDNNDGLEGDLQEAAVAEAERSRLVERERPDPQELAKKTRERCDASQENARHG